MGLYRRSWKDRDGKRHRSPIWWMSFVHYGQQHCESTGVTNRRAAQKIYDAKRGAIAEGRFEVLKKHAPCLKDWAEKYLKSVQHPNTRRRYAASKENLIAFFGQDAKLEHLRGDRIEEFKSARRAEGVKAATLNRDLRFMAQILKQAERERYIARNPFDRGKFFLNEAREKRNAHVLTWEEQEKLMGVVSPRLRVMIVLDVETGLRKGEMLRLKWQDIDFLNDAVHVGTTKTPAGSRAVPLSGECKSEL